MIRKVTRNRVLTRDQLLTVACYAESLFNERPLCIMDSDVDLVPLTPNSLVYGRSHRTVNHAVSDIDLDDPDFEFTKKRLTVMAQKLRSTLAHVRRVWQSEYLNFLATKDVGRRANAPSTKSRLLPSVGDVVLIKDSKDMRLGRILQLFLSEDGECRSARVRTKTGTEGCYPICNLRLLERGESVKADISGDISQPKNNPKEGNSVNVIKKPDEKESVRVIDNSESVSQPKHDQMQKDSIGEVETSKQYIPLPSYVPKSGESKGVIICDNMNEPNSRNVPRRKAAEKCRRGFLELYVSSF